MALRYDQMWGAQHLDGAPDLRRGSTEAWTLGGNWYLRDNLRFILENEPPLPGCGKRFVLNRIVDAAEEARLAALLAEHGQTPIRLPFDPAAYRRAGWDTARIPAGLLTGQALAKLEPEAVDRLWHATWARKNRAVMNNNGARNAALAAGRAAGAGWILPWDGNCFLTAEAWAALRAAVPETAPAPAPPRVQRIDLDEPAATED